MSSINPVILLSTDRRFQKNGSKLIQVALNLSEVFNDEVIVDQIESSLSCRKNAARLLNFLQVANQRNDNLSSLGAVDQLALTKILVEGISFLGFEDLSDQDYKDLLKSAYIDYKDLEFEVIDSPKSERAEFINQLMFNSTLSKESDKGIEGSTKQVTPLAQVSRNFQSSVSKKSSANFDVSDEDYWIQSVRLDFPVIPQPNVKEILYETTAHNQKYCMYGESTLPWNQSQITCLTDVNRFSSQDILNLFPPIRLYTRSPYMYRSYDHLELDDDLGVLLKISGFNKRQIKKNLLEYPHLDFLDREVKISGKTATIPFWKHIEIDGEIVSTASIWDKLDDTKKLPKTESFMREYVVRKYILESTVKGIEHKYPMRGTLLPFLTLYAPPEYYKERGYDPIEIGKQCIEARKSFKLTRNPVVKLNNQNAEMSV